MVQISVIGSLNYDLVTFTDKVPAGGETFQANLFENHIGGKGLNEAIAAARLTSADSPAEVRMIGNIGDDSFGKELKKSLDELGVNTELVATLPGISSGVAVIIVEENGENRILITAGANGQLKPTPEDYQRYFHHTAKGDFVILQNEYPDTAKSIEWLRSHRPHINIGYNPSPFKPELLTSTLLKSIDLLIVNEGEALDVVKRLEEPIKIEDKVAGFSKVAEKLQAALNPDNVSTVVVTLGSLGSIYTSKTVKATFHPAHKVEQVVDTTGAGDTFFGAVVVQLALHGDVGRAIAFATTASSLAIQKKGAASSIPSYKQVTSV